MSATSLSAAPTNGQPAWDVARLFPEQGNWSEGDYIDLTNRTNGLAELTDGRLEVLSMPSIEHQRIVRCLFTLLSGFVATEELGEVLFAPFRIRLSRGIFREPDLACLLSRHASRKHSQYWDGADLVIEVVSDEGRQRDLVEKPVDYAQAGIPEYWIVDPKEHRMTILKLDDRSYVTHSESDQGAVSCFLFPDLHIDVSSVFAAARQG